MGLPPGTRNEILQVIITETEIYSLEAYEYVKLKRKRFEENDDHPIIRELRRRRTLKWIPSNYKKLF